MTVPLALVALAFVVATLAPRLLVAAHWPRRSPRLGIIAWQAAIFTVLVAGVLLALTAVLPVERVSVDLGHVLHACPEVLRRSYAVFDGSWSHLTSLLAASGVLAALVVALVVRGLAVRRGRGRQRLLLDLLGRNRDTHSGAHIVEHDVPLAYCIPGGKGRIVVTSAAVEALDSRQLAAVLAHEHAHLDGRHDLVLFGADVATAAFPWSRFFRTARQELSALVEMLADDHAAQRSDRLSLASALVDLGQAQAPEGSVGATGDSLRRVQRLLQAAPAISRFRQALVLAFSFALVVTPFVIAVAPAWAARAGLCPVPSS